ncbi:dipeptidase [Arthrobacter ginkgonis]|uniref:Dipeptidase n=1 Tax=Arthrobacter ginkgonis TaxID=1630594 RepID=A0ABP7CLB0_9MICC
MTISPTLRVDAMESGAFDAAAFQALRDGGVDCATVTCGFWDDAIEAMDSIARWRDLVAANDQLVAIARNGKDIREITASGRTALLLGFQNTSAMQGRIRFVELFAELGVRVFQLTYNTQNDVGSSCYEGIDAGLTRYGREIVGELNRNGILVDLSHVGEQTCLDAIEASAHPVAVTHANAASLCAHPRNVSDRVIKSLAERGGVIGCALYPNLTGPDYAATLDDWCRMVVHTAGIAGIEHVGIGSDLGGTTDEQSLRWMREGRWTRQANFGAASASNPGDDDPEWFRSMEPFAALSEGLCRQGLDESEAAAVMGGNWMRLYDEVMA